MLPHRGVMGMFKCKKALEQTPNLTEGVTYPTWNNSESPGNIWWETLAAAKMLGFIFLVILTL